MRKRIVIILMCCVYFIFPLNAEQQKLDSLKTKLNALELTDTSRIHLLAKLCDSYSQYNIDSAMYYGKNCIKEALLSNKPELLAISFNAMGGVFFNVGKIDSAKYYHKKALELALNNDLYKISAKSYFKLANTFAFNNSPDTSIMYYKIALDLFSKLNMQDEVASCFSNMAIVYDKMGYIEKGLTYRLKSIAVFEELGNKQSMAIAYNNISSDYRNVGKLENANMYLKKAIQINKQTFNLHELQRNYTNFAVLLAIENKNDSAIIYYNKSLKVNQKLGNKRNIAMTLNAMSEFYFKNGMYNKSLESAQSSLDICKELNLSEGIMYNSLDLGKTFNKLEQYSDAGIKLIAALSIAKDYNIPNVIQSAYYELYISNKKSGNVLKALKYFELSQEIKDSLFTIEKDKAIEELTTKYETEKKDILIKKQQLTLNKERIENNILYISILGLVLILFLLVYIYLIIRRDKIRISENNVRIQEKNVELQQLTEEIKTQSEQLQKSNVQLVELSKFKENMTEMMVHDLKNPLSSILGFSSLDYSKRNMKFIYESGLNMLNMVTNILDVTKYEKTEMLVESRKEKISESITSSIDHLNYFLGIRELKFDYKITGDNYAIFDKKIINRVLINILSNAIKYSPKKGKITITCSNETIERKDFVKVCIHNQGEALSVNEAKKVFNKYSQLNPKKLGMNYSTGIGLAFCKLAIIAHKGQIGVESVEDKGVTFWFTLPKNKITN